MSDPKQPGFVAWALVHGGKISSMKLGIGEVWGCEFYHLEHLLETGELRDHIENFWHDLPPRLKKGNGVAEFWCDELVSRDEGPDTYTEMRIEFRSFDHRLGDEYRPSEDETPVAF